MGIVDAAKPRALLTVSIGIKSVELIRSTCIKTPNANGSEPIASATSVTRINPNEEGGHAVVVR